MLKYYKFLAYEVLPYITSNNKKPLSQQVDELKRSWARYHCLPYQYFKHRLYERGHRGDYIDYVPPIIIKNFQERRNPPDKLFMTVDKSETNRILSDHGIHCANTLLMIDAHGRLSKDKQCSSLSIDESLEVVSTGPDDLFVKPINGEVGNGAFVIRKAEVNRAFLLGARNILIQPRLTNHPTLAKMFDRSLNTIRIDTLLDGDDVIFTAACLKVGTGLSEVDNWAKGAIAIAVKLEDGALERTGVTKAAFGRRRYERHPNTNYVFKGTHIPHWPEVLNLARRGAQALRPHVTLGWDIAVTPSGPVILEANETGDFFLLQETAGPLASSELGKSAVALWNKLNNEPTA